MNYLLAISPVLVVLIGILLLKKPAMYVSAVAMVYSIIIAYFFFDVSIETATGQTTGGIIEGIKIVLLLFGAFTILTMMTDTGAMDKVKQVLAGITDDRRAQLIIIALMLGIFFEGAAGAGSPAALVGPFLVGLGFPAPIAATVALLGNATPPSWGGAGVTTINGSAALVEAGYGDLMAHTAAVSFFNGLAVMIVPLMMIWLAFGTKGFKGLWPFIIFSGLITGTCMLVFANFVGPETVTMGTGIVSILASVVFLKFVKLDTPQEYRYIPTGDGPKSDLPALKAFAPYIALCVLLPVVRLTVPWSILTMFGYTVWVATVIFLSAFVGSLFLGVNVLKFFAYAWAAFKKVFPALIAICSLLVVANLMKVGGMLELLGTGLAGVAGPFYPAVAVAVGSLGSFITGTGLGSNVMWAPMHLDAALALNMNPVTVFAGQNAGAALGNLICPNNVVAACATVNLQGKENEVYSRVFKPFFIILILYFVLAMLYTHVLIPNFGL